MNLNTDLLVPVLVMCVAASELSGLLGTVLTVQIQLLQFKVEILVARKLLKCF
jgi:hypothetical protein